MANLLDYVKWRGDITLKQVPFSELDGLVLSQIVFHDLDTVTEGESLTLREIEKRFFQKNQKETYRLGLFFPLTMSELLSEAASSVRFGDIRLVDVKRVNEEEKKIQFAAMTFLLPDRTVYVVYRGTDDSIHGWYESLGFGVFDGQACHAIAKDYLTDMMRRYRFRKFRVGGHSKGGHLAVYAAVTQEKRYLKRIAAVHRFDGPGFRANLDETDGYRYLRERIFSVTPDMSVVGSMLDYGEEMLVVDSEGKGIFQHDVFNWQILGNSFCYIEKRSEESYRVERSLKGWLDKVSDADKLKFLDAIYRLLTSSGAKTLSDISEDKMSSALSFGKTLLTFDKETRDVVSRAVVLLLKERKATLKQQKDLTKAGKKDKKESDD